MMNEKFKVGYIDEQQQWLSVFERNLEEQFEVVIFPITNDTTLDRIVEEIEAQNLDCLVVDYDLKESMLVTFNGDEVIAKVREKSPEFPVLIITGHDEEVVVSSVDDTDIVRTKVELAERTDLFIERLTGKITYFKKKIETIVNEINTLSTKKVESELTFPEEERLNTLYQEYDRLNPSEKGLPNVLYQPGNMSQLTELLSQTQQILDALSQQNKK